MFVSYGSFNRPYVIAGDGFNIIPEKLKYIKEQYGCLGGITEEDLYKNLEFIRQNIPVSTRLILLNGSEVKYECEKEQENYIRHVELNRVVEQFVENNENTYLLDIRKFVHTKNDLKDSIRHYKRHVYFQLSQELLRMIENF